jgi:pre-mRNA-splicing factor SYF1
LDWDSKGAQEGLMNARDVFEEAVKVKFVHADDLATVWCAWVEMELRVKNYQKALELTRRSLTMTKDTSNVAAVKVVRSKRLW